MSYATARGQAGAAGIAAGGLAATSARAFPADRSDNSYLRKPTRYRVVVRMDDRSTLRTFYLNAPDWRTGERVQVTDRGRLELLRV
ncbi:MAG: hypothetical protein JNJ60_10575 [Rhodocyclaceae bacterium]|nr:hypothetical protein [Rhodocyclaceae bacterium]